MKRASCLSSEESFLLELPSSFSISQRNDCLLLILLQSYNLTRFSWPRLSILLPINVSDPFVTVRKIVFWSLQTWIQIYLLRASSLTITNHKKIWCPSLQSTPNKKTAWCSRISTRLRHLHWSSTGFSTATKVLDATGTFIPRSLQDVVNQPSSEASRLKQRECFQRAGKGPHETSSLSIITARPATFLKMCAMRFERCTYVAQKSPQTDLKSLVPQLHQTFWRGPLRPCTLWRTFGIPVPTKVLEIPPNKRPKCAWYFSTNCRTDPVFYELHFENTLRGQWQMLTLWEISPVGAPRGSQLISFTLRENSSQSDLAEWNRIFAPRLFLMSMCNLEQNKQIGNLAASWYQGAPTNSIRIPNRRQANPGTIAGGYKASKSTAGGASGTPGRQPKID